MAPSFFFKPSRHLVVAVEADDVLYPEALKIAAHDILHFEQPVAFYQACSLDVFQRDPKHGRVNLLKRHRFGIITEDEDGKVAISISASRSPSIFRQRTLTRSCAVLIKLYEFALSRLTILI